MHFSKSIKFFQFLFVILFSGLLHAQQSVTVADVIAEIKQDSIQHYVESLESFGSRFLLYENRFEVADWLENKFREFGIDDVVRDSVEIYTKPGALFVYPIDTLTTQVNVVATIEGSKYPDDIYIICGHYDSYCRDIAVSKKNWGYAPGADDNASGTSAVLEAARAISAAGYQPEHTLKFIAFAAEELGNFGEMGSQKYAERAQETGEKIMLVVNNDMIGFSPNYPADKKLFFYYSNMDYSQEVVNLLDVAESFADLEFVDQEFFTGDLFHFTPKGYRGIYLEEHEFSNNINYHQRTDVSTNISFPFCTEAVKTATALLLSAPQNITGVENKEIPMAYNLSQNYPNPFNPTTTINFSIPKEGFVIIQVVNILGESVERLVNETLPAGNHRIRFNAGHLPAGVYFCRVSVNDWSASKKMVLLK